MLSASQSDLEVMMHGETGKLQNLKRVLEEEMKRISEDFISSCPQESETYVDNIRKLKNYYQYVIKDMVDMYRNVLKKPEVLDDWTKEVDDIGNAVKKHVDMIKPKLYHYLPLCQQYLGMSGHGHTVVFHHLKGKRQSSQLVRRLVVLLGLRTFYQLQGRRQSSQLVWRLVMIVG